MPFKYYQSLRASSRLARKKSSYLNLSGWIDSVTEKKPIDNQGNIVPWMNYAVISILKERLNKNIKLFEYGSGFSTLFYCQRVKHVVSIEYDPTWYDKIKNQAPENSEIKLFDKDVDGNYCRSINATNDHYDVVVIDGRDRVNCLKQALNKLSEEGVIIFDDSSRPRYQEAFTIANNAGFKQLTFEGLKPTSTGLFKTTLFYRPENCLDI